MKLVMTLLVRDEADIVDTHIAYHLAAGVDCVIATDHRSADGTTDILESYARDGHVHLIRRDDERIRQSAWMTEMARLAATEHGADWVLNSDADEFWWPAAPSLKDALAAVPETHGVVYAVSRVFVPRPGSGWFAERMTVRLELPAAINDPATPYRHVAKVAHRAHAGAVVMQGNHRVSGVPFRDIRGWSPLELLHFPLRSPEQAAAKHENTWTAWDLNLRGDIAIARSTSRYYDRLVLDDDAVARGLAAGSLAEDTRLRDALRALRDEGSLWLGPQQFAQRASHALDDVLLFEADGVRLQRRADELAGRVYGSAQP
jgi:glycosyl transferase family 2